MEIIEADKMKNRKKIDRLINRLISDKEIERKVAKIIRDVQLKGDIAVSEYTRKFDRVILIPKNFKVAKTELNEAKKLIDPDFYNLLEKIKRNVINYHKHQLRSSWQITNSNGSSLGEIIIPINTIGVYIPAGTAPLVSSVLMTVVPAQIAGVKKIIIATPPDKKGKVNPYILMACSYLGITDIYKIGGAQAIAAIAFGTKTIPKVEKIFGPGNIYVTTAKKLLYGTVAIDSLYGPSEILIIADSSANPSHIAADLLSQAEHGTGKEIALLVTPSRNLAEKVSAEVKRQFAKLKKENRTKSAILKSTKIVVTKNLQKSIEFTNNFAPEHLEIITKNPRKILFQIKNAGAIFIGQYSPVPVGDFIAGPSHVLPTTGAARASSGLSVNDFTKRISTIEYTKKSLKKIKNDLAKIAEIEQLPAHSLAVQKRFK